MVLDGANTYGMNTVVNPGATLQVDGGAIRSIG